MVLKDTQKQKKTKIVIFGPSLKVRKTIKSFSIIILDAKFRFASGNKFVQGLNKFQKKKQFL